MTYIRVNRDNFRQHETMSVVREAYEDLVADCYNNLDTLNLAAEQIPKRAGPVYNYRRDQLQDAFKEYHISVNKLVAFHKKQQIQRQLDPYDLKHLTELCKYYSDELRKMLEHLEAAGLLHEEPSEE